MKMYELIYNFVAENLGLFRLFYSSFIALICLVIVLKTNEMFKINNHQGIRYFRNAFFFYGIAFMFRYLLSITYFATPIFEFFMIMAGFFLLYSLIWSKFEDKGSISSLFNSYIFLFYIITIIMVSIDFFTQSYMILFSSQIIIFALTSIISFKNIKNGGFSRAYHILMILSLLAWALNLIFVVFLYGEFKFVVNIYLLNIIVFIVFLYEVLKVMK